MSRAGGFSESLLIARRRAGLSQEELGFRAALHRTEIGELRARSSSLVRACGYRAR